MSRSVHILRVLLRRWWQRPSGGRAVVQLALPLVLSTASWSVMHFVDRVFLTWYSTEAIAAAMPAGMLYFTLLCLPLGIASYVNTFVAQYWGAGRPQRIGLALWQGVSIGLMAIPYFLLMIPLAPLVFEWADHGPSIAELEVTYFRTLALGAGGAVISTALASFFTGLGHSRVVMVVDSSAALLNIVLDYLLIFGHAGLPELGIFGAGLTTTISQWSKVFVYAAILSRSEFRVPFQLVQGCRIDLPLLGRLFRFGGPSGLQLFLETLAFTGYLFLMGRLGTMALAASTIAFSVNTMAFVPMLGLGIAVTTLVGQRLGRNQSALAARATWSAFVLGGLYVGVMAVLYVSCPQLFLAAHAAGGSAEELVELRETCIILLRFVAVYCFLDMMHIVFVSALKGAGDTRFVLGTTVLVSPIPVLLGWLGLSRWNWDLTAYWVVITGWICLLGVVYISRFVQGKWKKMRVIEPDPVAPVRAETPLSVAN